MPTAEQRDLALLNRLLGRADAGPGEVSPPAALRRLDRAQRRRMRTAGLQARYWLGRASGAEGRARPAGTRG